MRKRSRALATASERGRPHPAIEMWPLARLHPSKRNVRTHPRRQRRKLAAILRRIGFIDPIVVDEDGMILSGHLRFDAAKELELETVPVVRITHLTDVEKRTYALAANRIGLDAGWDRKMLAVELGELAIQLPEINLDIEITGFDVAEFDTITLDHAEPGARPAQEDQVLAAGPAVTRLGDLWLMSGHRLLCGDARDSMSYARLMDGPIAVMVFTDPPYNVSIQRHARGKGRTKHREFAMASGEMSEDEFRAFLQQVLSLIAQVTAEGGIVYICMDWRHLEVLLAVGRNVFNELKNICVWAKSNGAMGSFYRGQHEMIAVYKRGTAEHLNTFELGQHGRSRTNLWTYAGVNAFKAGRRDELDMHPTVKPVALVADAMRDCSRPGSVVLDPFMGAGTTIMAAEKVGRHGYGIELDPQYVDVAVRRWQAFTGRDAILETTGQTFEQVQDGRVRERSPSAGLRRRSASPMQQRTASLDRARTVGAKSNASHRAKRGETT